MTRSGCLIIFLLGLPLLLGISGELFWIAHSESHLLVGWTAYLKRTLPKVRIDFNAIAIGAVCLMGSFFFTHQFLKWFYVSIAVAGEGSEGRQQVTPVWKKKWTAYGISLVLLAFVAGICAVGLIHQSIWLFNSFNLSYS